MKGKKVEKEKLRTKREKIKIEGKEYISNTK